MKAILAGEMRNGPTAIFIPELSPTLNIPNMDGTYSVFYYDGEKEIIKETKEITGYVFNFKRKVRI